ncbi:MAG: valine--tRNA ligase [Acidobacteriota bacterium]|jgi:valyl-tRNA synthetase|nr:valine--tRNA ligase [Acidobacteriota bacterium]
MSREPLAKSYAPREFEQRWYSFWEERGFFKADNASPKPVFSIVIPPPNVTGSLHMGHALQHTLHDILVRWKRMKGCNTLWLPGTDHASIAVHYVLDKQFEAAGKDRFKMGRDEFMRTAWEWKKTSGGTILNQMRRMGVSCDWSRERFTMDEQLSRAVVEVFVRLYEQGLIYRGEYIVNWCPRCKTAISDLEVVYNPSRGHLWHIKYPIVGADGKASGRLTVATTRPETMLGDTAVAVHPDDERYAHLVGGKVLLPVANREIPIIADGFVDREFGTGVVKVTPAHDANDYEAGIRNGLDKITVIDDAGVMTEAAGEYKGLDRYECRRLLVERLEKEGFLEKVEEYDHNVGQCDRCSAVVEPKISIQWYLKVATLAKPAIEAVEDGRIRFVPDNFKKRYFEWMYNIHDWCISRQLWWGHRIPAWYCDVCGKIVVAREEPANCPTCGAGLRAEEDILDTWFSSALWPFSTLGWPEDTDDLATFYPTDTLITGPDIIFFWVARMIMMGLKFTGDIPFSQVHINGIVRDEHGHKMSKTKGNIIEPLQLIDEYGADAVRFTLSSMAVPGTDIPFSSKRMKGYSDFANKVWNAARFVLMNLREEDDAGGFAEAAAIDGLVAARRDAMPLEDLWILHRMNQTAAGVSEALDKFRFHEASALIYQFFWHELCDWYIELVKPVLTDPDAPEAERAPRIRVLLHVLDYALRMLHPFMPFITEEIWQKLPHQGESLMMAAFPEARAALDNPGAAQKMQDLMELIGDIRTLRAKMNINPKQPLKACLSAEAEGAQALVEQNLARLLALTRLEAVEFRDAVPDGWLRGVSRLGSFGLDVPVADVAAARKRFQDEIKKLKAEIEKVSRKLDSPDFVARAPKEIVDENRSRFEEMTEKCKKLENNLEQLPSA